MAVGRLLGAALLFGAGVLVVAGVAASPVILRRARPILREGLKRGMTLYEKARGAAAELAEDIEDLVAEVKNDLSTEQRPPPTTINLADVAKEA